MKRKGIVITLMVIMILSVSSTAFAAGWQKDSIGWWWQNENGSYPFHAWQWIDGNGDGVAECYYFDENGYCLLNTTTPDGYYVNMDGAWVVNVAVQTKMVELQTAIENQEQNRADIYGNYRNSYDEWISLTEENGVLVLRYYEDKGGEIEVLVTEMNKVNETIYQSTIYDAVNIKFTDNITFEFYDGMVYIKQ